MAKTTTTPNMTEIMKLQAQLDALKAENDRLKAEAEAKKGGKTKIELLVDAITAHGAAVKEGGVEVIQSTWKLLNEHLQSNRVGQKPMIVKPLFPEMKTFDEKELKSRLVKVFETHPDDGGLTIGSLLKGAAVPETMADDASTFISSNYTKTNERGRPKFAPAA